MFPGLNLMRCVVKRIYSQKCTFNFYSAAIKLNGTFKKFPSANL